MDRDALILLAWESPNRVIKYEEVSRQLQVPLEHVEVELIRVIAKGIIRGRVDAEQQQMIVDAVNAPASAEYVRKTRDGLKQIEARLNAEIYGSTRAQKRSRSPLEL